MQGRKGSREGGRKDIQEGRIYRKEGSYTEEKETKERRKRDITEQRKIRREDEWKEKVRKEHDGT
jgi:hypothetical protein